MTIVVINSLRVEMYSLNFDNTSPVLYQTDLPSLKRLSFYKKKKKGSELYDYTSS